MVAIEFSHLYRGRIVDTYMNDDCSTAQARRTAAKEGYSWSKKMLVMKYVMSIATHCAMFLITTDNHFTTIPAVQLDKVHDTRAMSVRSSQWSKR